uniref:Putative secreted protein n=1 Tax=Ixodes ricinus TaxID=34613 RepID=A0A6B0UBI7_IXORI
MASLGSWFCSRLKAKGLYLTCSLFLLSCATYGYYSSRTSHMHTAGAEKLTGFHDTIDYSRTLLICCPIIYTVPDVMFDNATSVELPYGRAH